MTYNLGFIGGGNMSTAIVRGILKNGTHPASNIWVSSPHLENLKPWAEMGTNVTDKNGIVFSNCDVIFLGVKPAMLSEAVNDCLNSLPTPTPHKPVLVISMLAGINLKDLRQKTEVLSTKIRIVRIMPNTAAAVGAGACLYTPDDRVTKEDCNIVETLMKSCGICESVKESVMESLGSLVGCGPAYMYIVMEALADGAVKQGVQREQALRIAAQMVLGSAMMMKMTGKHPGQLKDEVCSPGGSTIAGVAVLEECAVRSAFIKAIEASSRRTKELGK